MDIWVHVRIPWPLLIDDFLGVWFLYPKPTVTLGLDWNSVLRSTAWALNLLFQEVPKGQSEEDMVGRPLPHLAADMQASGEAVYCDDIPRYENELSLRLVTSTRAHAKIKWVWLLGRGQWPWERRDLGWFTRLCLPRGPSTAPQPGEW